MRFATFTMSADPRERVRTCTPDGASLTDIAQVSVDAGRPRWGAIVSLIAAAAGGLPAWLRTLASDSSARALPLAEVRLLAPIPRPRKSIYCVGPNCREHIAGGAFAEVAGASHPVFPEFFTKAPASVVASLEPVPRHAGVTGQLDYKGELGVVIGRGGKNIPTGRAFEHAFGWTGRGALRTDHVARRAGSTAQLPRISPFAYERDAPGRDVFAFFMKQILPGVGWGRRARKAPLAPAIANAVFAATGQPIRSLPLVNHELKHNHSQ